MIVTLLALLMYSVVYPLTWFENKYAIHDQLGRPIWYTRNNQVKLFLLKITLFLASVCLIWHIFSFVAAIVAFVMVLVFSKITFKIYYGKLYHELLRRYVAVIENDARIAENSFIQMQASNMAKNRIISNMKGNWY